jgi:HAD superfamily hydrolase (TIGR01490 family)
LSYAFFDLDQTLLPYDTQALFCQHVLQREGWRRAYLLVFLPVVPLAALKLIGSRGLKRVFLSYLWRMPKTRLAEHVESFVSEKVKPLIYPELRAELEKHQAAGHITVLNTASPEIYAHAIARMLGFQHCYATRVDLGTGDRVPFCPAIIGTNNKRAAKLPAMREILPPGALDAGAAPIPGSHAYSDSHADLPMLSLAESATMVHPTAELAAAGAVKGWQTVRPRRPFAGKWGYRIACFRQAFGL